MKTLPIISVLVLLAATGQMLFAGNIEDSGKVSEVQLKADRVGLQDLSITETQMLFPENSWDEFSSACPFLSDSFGSLNAWKFSNVKKRIVNGQLEMTSSSSSKMGYASHNFNPTRFFTLEMNVRKDVNKNWLGFEPFNNEGPVFQIGNYKLDGLGAALMKDGRVGLVGYAYYGTGWVIFNPAQYGPVNKLGVTYASNRIALRVNGKEVFKISGNINRVPDQDSIWLIVSGLGTRAKFDNPCGR